MEQAARKAAEVSIIVDVAGIEPSPEDAAAIGVWIHGRAGDILTALHTAEAYDSRDLIGELDEGFCELYNDTL